MSFSREKKEKTTKILQTTYESPVPDISNSRWVHERSDAGV
jgi:hypothetical protein